jgi:hypothetical protein
MIEHVVSLLGFVAFASLAWLFSSNRRRIAWKTIAWGVALQLVIGLIIFRLPGSHRLLLWLNDAVVALLNASKSGSVFLFGGQSGGVRLRRFHSRFSSASGSDLLRGIHRDALSLARVAGLRPTLRQALSSHDEDQRRRVTLECGEHFRRD